MRRGEYIKRRRQELDINQEELSKKVGTTQAQISKWENGQMPKFDNIESLAIALEVSLPVFIKKAGYTECFSDQEGSGEKSDASGDYEKTIIEELRRIKEKIERLEKNTPASSGSMTVENPQQNQCPVISGSASCGSPFSITDNCIEDYIYYPPGIDADFAIHARGYSMVENGIIPGTICFVKKSEPQSGDIAAICVYSGEETYPVLKTVKYRKGEPEFFDGKGERIFFGKDMELEIIGKVVGMMTLPGKK